MLTETFLRKAVLARCAIDLCERKVLHKSDFSKLLTKGPLAPPALRMTQSEATAFADSLKRSKAIVEVGEYVYIDARAAVDAVHLRAGLPLVSSSSERLEETRQALSHRIAKYREQGASAVENAVRKEKEFWAFTALGSGVQMLVLSYLTFQVYGWDVMEPVTFFVTTATALCSYAYFLYFRREHSYESVDDSFLPYRLSKELKRSNFDAKTMVRDIEALRELQSVAPGDSTRSAQLIKDALQQSWKGRD